MVFQKFRRHGKVPSENFVWTYWWIKMSSVSAYFKHSCESSGREIKFFVFFLNLIQVHQFTCNLPHWSPLTRGFTTRKAKNPISWMRPSWIFLFLVSIPPSLHVWNHRNFESVRCHQKCLLIYPVTVDRTGEPVVPGDKVLVSHHKNGLRAFNGREKSLMEFSLNVFTEFSDKKN